MNYDYYVYAYIRTDGTPYYIGKGRGRRAYSSHRYVKPPTDKNRIIFLETMLSDIGACALERRYIRWWGRKNLGTGILHNRTDGGDGVEGRVVSESTRKKFSEIHRGKIISAEHKASITAKLSGKTRDDDVKQKISKASCERLGLGTYVTPWGVFTSINTAYLDKNAPISDKPLRTAYKDLDAAASDKTRSKLQALPHQLTWRDMGFDYIPPS